MNLHFSFLNVIDTIESWCTETQIDNKDLINQAVHFITSSDEFRKRNIDDYIPGLLDELKSYV